jgi:glycerophosphoryl diester phosphodiesterase
MMHYGSCCVVQMRDTGKSLEDIVLDALQATGYNLSAQLNSPGWLSMPVFLQSFESSSLKRMARRTCLPLVMLLGSQDRCMGMMTCLPLVMLLEAGAWQGSDIAQ